MRAIQAAALLLPVAAAAGGTTLDPQPALARVLRAFYPDGPGLAAKGLMVEALLPGSRRADLLFLHPRGWIRRQVGGAGKGGVRELIGPRGAFRCRGRKAGEPLGGEALARLRLVREALALTALWPLLEEGARVEGRHPLVVRCAGGALLELALDGEGLPRSITRVEAERRKLRVTIPPDTPRRKSASGRWPGRLAASRPGGPDLVLELRRVTGFQLASRRSFFCPPDPEKGSDEPFLPPGVRPGRLDFQAFPRRRAVRIAAPRSAKARDQILLRAKGQLEGAGFEVSGLPLFTRLAGGWSILLQVEGEGRLPEGMTLTSTTGGLHALTFHLGDWGVEILERAVRLEREAWHKGYRALGPPLIIPYHRPGGKEAEAGRLLTEIRLPVAHRDRD